MRLFGRHTRTGLAAAGVLCCTGIWGAPKVPETHTIRVCVRAQSEQPILSPEDFIVRVNGKAAPVLSAKTPQDKQMILAVLDLAGDMTNAQTAKDALIAEIQKLPETI